MNTKPSKILFNKALDAQQKAICPFSQYKVGAALQTTNNKIIIGFNIESKAYPTTLCAERVAIFSALSQDHDDFDSMVIITDDQGHPCGGCLQILHEFAPNIKLWVSDNKGNMTLYSIDDLLPHPFG